MEDKAISMLQTILKRRGQESEKKQYTTDVQRVNAYVLGTTLVFASQKDKLTERDILPLIEELEKSGLKSLVILSKSPASQNVLKAIRANASKVQFYHIQELQMDITTHRMYMPHYIYNEKFIAENPLVAKAYEAAKIKSPKDELPRIDSQDIVVRLIGAVPGDIVYIRRHSDTSGYSHYWRQVVEDANLTE